MRLTGDRGALPCSAYATASSIFFMRGSIEGWGHDCRLLRCGSPRDWSGRSVRR